MENSKRGLLPFMHGVHLFKKMYPSTSKKIQCMSKIPYASTIRSLMYAMLCTRSDIALTVNVTSRYQLNPSKKYWIIMKNILKYLRKIKDLFLIFGGGDLRVQRYINSNFIFDIDDIKLTSDFMFLYNGGTVS